MAGLAWAGFFYWHEQMAGWHEAKPGGSESATKV
jgi:hypothetical protein